jgi:uncharacterized protein (DUF4415 family)
VNARPPKEPFQEIGKLETVNHKMGLCVASRFFKPIKQKELTIRLDSDVVEWFKRNICHYQSAINKAL